MADVVTVNVATGEKTERNFTAAELADRDARAAAAAAEKTATAQREQRRQQAIDRLNAYVAMGAGATAAQVRTESQFVAKVLAVVLPFIDIDPGS